MDMITGALLWVFDRTIGWLIDHTFGAVLRRVNRADQKAADLRDFRALITDATNMAHKAGTGLTKDRHYRGEAVALSENAYALSVSIGDTELTKRTKDARAAIRAFTHNEAPRDAYMTACDAVLDRIGELLKER